MGVNISLVDDQDTNLKEKTNPAFEISDEGFESTLGGNDTGTDSSGKSSRKLSPVKRNLEDVPEDISESTESHNSTENSNV